MSHFLHSLVWGMGLNMAFGILVVNMEFGILLIDSGFNFGSFSS
jgi:hypothetical protein